jgi:hypothetical protein
MHSRLKNTQQRGRAYLVAMDRNRWSRSAGIGGRDGPESVDGIKRIQWSRWTGLRINSIKSEKNAPAVNLRVFNDGFTIECGKHKSSHGVISKVNKTNKGNAADVYINKADFVEVFNAVSLLPVVGSVGFTIDFDGLVKFSFETWVGYFEVFVPTSTQGGERRHTHFRNLTPTPWPVEAEVTKADTTATSDTSEA